MAGTGTEPVQRSWMASRVSQLGTTIFTEMSALAREHGAVNLGQGFPDFDGPDELKQVVTEAMRSGQNQYAMMPGEPALREAVAAHARRFYRQTVDPQTEVTVTSGATEALWCCAFAFLEPGDEVIIFEPVYDSYIPAIEMAGGIPVAVTLHAPEFRFDHEELRNAITPRTRAIYVNTPHNPTGTVFSRQELEQIAALCIEHGILAITDEVYEHIVFSPADHLRLATLPGMWDRTLTLSSGGKTFSFTGWKIGWAIGPAELQTAFRRVHQFTTFATSTPMQYAIARGLALSDSYFSELIADYTARRDFLVDTMQQAGLRPRVPDGSYFVTSDIAGVTGMNAADYCRWMVRELGVAAIPLSGFYVRSDEGEKLVRFCFCKKWETLHAAAERLMRLRG